MDALALDGLAVIVSCVFLGWVVSSYLAEGHFKLSAPTIYGTSPSLVFARIGVWFAAIGFTAASMIALAVTAPSVTVLAILFGIQAMLFDFCSRIRFLRRSNSARSRHRIAVSWPRHS
jgi:hypothetical protein